MIKKIIHLLPAEARRRSWRVILVVLIRALLDFAGVAALIPLLLTVLKPGATRMQMLGLCGTVMLFVLLKNTLITVLARMESRF